MQLASSLGRRVLNGFESPYYVDHLVIWWDKFTKMQTHFMVL